MLVSLKFFFMPFNQIFPNQKFLQLFVVLLMWSTAVPVSLVEAADSPEAGLVFALSSMKGKF